MPMLTSTCLQNNRRSRKYHQNIQLCLIQIRDLIVRTELSRRSLLHRRSNASSVLRLSCIVLSQRFAVALKENSIRIEKKKVVNLRSYRRTNLHCVEREKRSFY